MAGVPSWSAARNGVLGNPGAVDASAQINQFLGAHGVTPIYQGAQILTQNGAGLGFTTPTSFWSLHLDGTDYDQPFTMSGTAIGRVTVPVLPVGTGADLIVSLCPDSSGSPGAPITTARIPAAWITQLAAVGGSAGPSSQLQLATPTSAPLALPQFNPLMTSGSIGYAWAPPAPTSAGAISSPVALSSGNYLILVGGGASGGAAVANVYTVPWQGGSSLGSAVAQPSLPQPLNITALMANSTTLITAGGLANGSSAIAAVYTASWNQSTGQVSAWTAQTSLPQALSAAFGAATSTACYVVGGQDVTGAILLNTAYWAVISNGQISSWNTGPPLPAPVKGPFVGIVGNFLVVAGGYTNATNTATTNAVYYAAINANNSLGPWQAGPPLPYPVGNAASGDLVVDPAGLTIIGGYNGSAFSTEIQTLSFGPNGPGAWSLATNAAPDGNGVFTLGAGQWQVFSLFSTSYSTATLYQVPYVSVPLPTTGLTNGATYHVMLKQAGGDLNDYLRMPLQNGPFPGNPTVLSRASNGGSAWMPGTSGRAIPIGVFDQTISGQPLHMWSDSGARHSMLVNTSTPDGTLLGVLEATAQPGPVLNMAPTFTSGLGPWTATGGTAALSSTYTHGNLPYSAQVTPSGSAATTQIESEQVAVYQGHSYTATAWLYSAVGYSSAVVNINWYNASHMLLSTTTGTTTSLTAGTWTQIITTGAVPASAAYATVVTAETGTPAATAVFYVSTAALQDASGPMLPAVTQINYTGAWPNAVSQSQGLTKLA